MTSLTAQRIQLALNLREYVLILFAVGCVGVLVAFTGEPVQSLKEYKQSVPAMARHALLP